MNDNLIFKLKKWQILCYVIACVVLVGYFLFNGPQFLGLKAIILFYIPLLTISILLNFEVELKENIIHYKLFGFNFFKDDISKMEVKKIDNGVRILDKNGLDYWNSTKSFELKTNS